MEPECRAAITVTGRVQGVGYRYSTLQVAKNLELKGFVKNLPDDSVYMEAQGIRQEVLKLADWCRTGPPRAIVEEVKIQWIPVVEGIGFQIR